MTTIPQRHRRMDRQTDGHPDEQTTCHGNTALCVTSRGKNSNEDRLIYHYLHYQRLKCSAETLVCKDIRVMPISGVYSIEAWTQPASLKK